MRLKCTIPLIILMSFMATALSQPLKVAFFDQPGAEVLTKIAIRVWTDAASNLNSPFVLVKAATADTAFKALRAKKVDVVIGPLRLDKSAAGIDYVNSYIHDSLGIIIPNRQHISFTQTLAGYFEALFGFTVLGIFIIIFLFGIVIWSAERKKNPTMFSKNPVKGIATSVWACLVTFSTVGYGDIVPRTLVGRILTGVWIVISLFLVSVFVASITSELTYMKTKLDHLTSLSELYGKKVGMVKGSATAMSSIKHYHADPVMYDTLTALVTAVSKKQVYAGMANMYVLKSYLDENHPTGAILTSFELQQGYYAFALINNNAKTAELSRELYTLSEDGRINEAISSVVGSMRMKQKDGL